MIAITCFLYLNPKESSIPITTPESTYFTFCLKTGAIFLVSVALLSF